MTEYTKPPVFNAVQAMKRIDEQESRIRQLEDEKHRLEMRLIELKGENTNHEIHIRILQEKLEKYEQTDNRRQPGETEGN